MSESSFTHLDKNGNARMVNIGEKSASDRMALAAGEISLSAAAFTALTTGTAAKGNVLAVARIAAINATKRTADIIPLCHMLPLDEVIVDFKTDDDKRLLHCQVTVRLCAKTGPEMEALVGVQVALLTIYDMLKAIDKNMIIGNLRLLEKSGGKSGHYKNE